MFSGRGYCTESGCFPAAGTPPTVVFLCKVHCRRMLCYPHWLAHHKLKSTSEDNEINIDDSLSNLESDFNENEKSSDFSHEDEFHTIDKTMSTEGSASGEPIFSNEDESDAEIKVVTKEVEWWNEIKPWKNNEDFTQNMNECSSIDTIADSNDHNYNSSKYPMKRTRKINKESMVTTMACRSYSGQCPLIFDGAFGLIQAYHQHQLCSSSKSLSKTICLYQHFHSKHGFTSEVSIRLVKAVIRQQDPHKTKLFSMITDTPSTLYNPYHKVKCPLSTRHDIINTPCLIQKMNRKSIRRHLFGVHRLDQKTIDQLIKNMTK